MWLYFIDKNIKEVRKNLKNVLYGEMTVGNVSYFNMMIDEINK